MPPWKCPQAMIRCDARFQLFWSNLADASTSLGDAGGEFQTLQAQQRIGESAGQSAVDLPVAATMEGFVLEIAASGGDLRQGTGSARAGLPRAHPVVPRANELGLYYYPPTGTGPMQDGNWSLIFRLPEVPDSACQDSVS